MLRNKIVKLLNEGLTAYKFLDFNTAAEKFQYIITINPNIFEAHVNLGNSHLMQKKYDEAIQSFMKALELFPASVSAFINLGNCYFQKKLFGEATHYWKIAYNIDPQKTNTLINIGVAYDRLGDRFNAFKYYDLYFLHNKSISSSETSLKMTLAQLKDSSLKVIKNADDLEKRGSIDTALTLLTKSAKAYPILPKTYDMLGNIYYKKGDLQNAVFHYEKAIDLNPNSDITCCNLGVLYDKLKDFFHAYFYYYKYSHSFAITPQDKNKIHDRMAILKNKIRQEPQTLTQLDEKMSTAMRDKQYEKALEIVYKIIDTDIYQEHRPKFMTRLAEIQNLLNPLEKSKTFLLEKADKLVQQKDFTSALMSYYNYLNIVGIDRVAPQVKEKMELCHQAVLKAEHNT